MRRYFYTLLYKYISIFLPSSGSFFEYIPPDCISGEDIKKKFRKKINMEAIDDIENLPDNFSHLLLNGIIHYERDLNRFFEKIYKKSSSESRIIITYYSSLWKPLINFATFIGIRKKTPEKNWISPNDIKNILFLENFETVFDDSKVLFPLYIPFLSNFFNRYIAPLPLIRHLNLMHILIARPLKERFNKKPSVSIVIPARNEEKNIEEAVLRIPKMGDDDEIIFVEGHSKDNTWEEIKRVKEKYKELNIIIAQQDGKGKGDAVRKGFSLATKDIFMILDADLTVPPEDLPLFYRAITENKGELVMGSRLVYPMEERAMRFCNMIGNKFFAGAFSFILNQRFKDTLCGTKVLTKEQYNLIMRERGYFGDFDPFGDFDIIFGAVRMGLKVREIPIRYRERKYGDTNINRWRDGAILLKMSLYAARKMKFV
ncbi:MAG: glycosyltransferase family 2 protein [Proteobacteria bacterium]|nr:glycosyltransferase family 2 protein [Pseudomonadota bacterium]